MTPHIELELISQYTEEAELEEEYEEEDEV